LFLRAGIGSSGTDVNNTIVVRSAPHCGQGVANVAFTFSRLIFRRTGIRGFYFPVTSLLMILVLFEAGAFISFTKFFAVLPGKVPVLCDCKLP
jgi:hypothetical protein